MKKIIFVIVCSLFSNAAYSQAPFVTYNLVRVPERNYDFSPPPVINYNIIPSTPSVKLTNSDIVTTNALCVQPGQDNFIIGAKVMIKQYSNGSNTLSLEGLEDEDGWSSIDAIDLISIPIALQSTTDKETKEFLLSISEFKYLAIIDDNCFLLFK
jgi:uncharacterized protein YkuJ